MAKKAASKRIKKAAFSGAGHAGSITNGFDRSHINEHFHDTL